MSGEDEDGLSGSTIQIEQKLRRMNEEWVEALIHKDTSTLNRLMDQRRLFTDALTGDDKAQFIADIESGDLEVDSLARDNVEVRVYGATAVMTALDTADWKYKGRRIDGHYRTIEVKKKKFRVPTLVGRRETHSLPPKGGTLNTASFFFRKSFSLNLYSRICGKKRSLADRGHSGESH